MVRISGLTLSGLLDRVEDHLRRTTPGRISIAPRGFVADAAGSLSVFALPASPDGGGGREALGAALDAELRRREAAICVLVFERWIIPGPEGTIPAEGTLAEHPDRRECIVLEGLEVAGNSRPSELRLLEIVRRGRKIVSLRRP